MYHPILKLNQITKSVKSVKEVGFFSCKQNRTHNSGAVLEKLLFLIILETSFWKPYGGRNMLVKCYWKRLHILKKPTVVMLVNGWEVNCLMKTYYSWINEQWTSKRWRWTRNKVWLVNVIFSGCPLPASGETFLSRTIVAMPEWCGLLYNTIGWDLLTSKIRRKQIFLYL